MIHLSNVNVVNHCIEVQKKEVMDPWPHWNTIDNCKGFKYQSWNGVQGRELVLIGPVMVFLLVCLSVLIQHLPEEDNSSLLRCIAKLLQLEKYIYQESVSKSGTNKAILSGDPFCCCATILYTYGHYIYFGINLESYQSYHIHLCTCIHAIRVVKQLYFASKSNYLCTNQASQHQR